MAESNQRALDTTASTVGATQLLIFYALLCSKC